MVECMIWLFQLKIYAKHKKIQQREVAAVFDAIKKISSKIINGMPLTFVLVYREDAMFARIMGIYLIMFNNNLVYLRCIGCESDKCIVNI